MTLAVVTSRALAGMEAPEVVVEAHLSNGLPSFTLVGLAEAEVKEARDRVRAALVRGILAFSQELGLNVVAEGVETVAELAALRAAGVRLFQGYLLAHPAFQALPAINWDAVAEVA